MMLTTEAQMCPICGSSDHGTKRVSLLDVHGYRDVLICTHCGHGWDFEPHVDLALYYDKLYDCPPRPRFSPAFWKIAQYLTRHRKGKATKALDIGANNGRFLWHLPQIWDLYGVEPASGAVAVARQYTKSTILEGTFDEIPIEQHGPYDIITCWAVLEHVVDPVALLRRASAALNTGGLLGVMTGDRTSQLARIQDAGWHQYRPAGHLHFFSERSFAYSMESAKLGIMRKSWTTGNFIGRRGVILSRIQQVFNTVYDLSPLTRTNRYDHLYVFAVRDNR